MSHEYYHGYVLSTCLDLFIHAHMVMSIIFICVFGCIDNDSNNDNNKIVIIVVVIVIIIIRIVYNSNNNNNNTHIPHIFIVYGKPLQDLPFKKI